MSTDAPADNPAAPAAGREPKPTDLTVFPHADGRTWFVGNAKNGWLLTQDGRWRYWRPDEPCNCGQWPTEAEARAAFASAPPPAAPGATPGVEARAAAVVARVAGAGAAAERDAANERAERYHDIIDRADGPMLRLRRAVGFDRDPYMCWGEATIDAADYCGRAVDLIASLRAERDAAVRALAFYADEDMYDSFVYPEINETNGPTVMVDRGQRARDALGDARPAATAGDAAPARREAPE